MVGYLLVVIRWGLAVTLGVAGYAKARDRTARQELADTLRRGLHLPVGRAGVAAFVAAESAAALLLVLPAVRAAGAVLALIMFAGLAGGSAVLAGRAEQFRCACFGAPDRVIDTRTVMRNLALAAAAGVLVWRDASGAHSAEAELAGVLTVAVVLLLATHRRELRLAAIVRQRQQHASGGQVPVALPPSGPVVGGPAPELGRLAGVELAGHGYLLAFFSSTCRGCRASLPHFQVYASGWRDPVVAVVVGDAAQGADIVRLAGQAATVLTEPSAGPISRAHQIALFPTYVLVDAAHRVTATANSIMDLPRPTQLAS